MSLSGITRRIRNLGRKIRNGLRFRKRRHAALATRKSQIADRRAYIARLRERRAKTDDPDRRDALNREIKAIQAQVDDLVAHRVRIIDTIRKATAAIQRRKRRRKALRRRKRALRERIVTSPGPPHWGGCEDILRNEVDPVAMRLGHAQTSAKRSETFGNPGTDHYIGQVLASARDYTPGLSLAIAIAKSLGVPYYGYADDYKLYYIRRDGHTYRVQIIASNHGTGPHVHVGIRRMS